MDVLVELVAVLLVRLRIILKKEMLCLSIFSQQIFCSLLLLVDKKSNFSDVFKLKPVIIYFIKFIMKTL